LEFLCAEKSFSFSVALHELKKFAFFANQKFSTYRKFYALPSKASRFRNQNTACLNYFLLSAKTAFSHTKNLLVHKPFLVAIQSIPFLPSASHSHNP
jgi:hypothetical protein